MGTPVQNVEKQEELTLEDVNVFEVAMLYFLGSFEAAGNNLVIHKKSLMAEIVADFYALGLADVKDVGDGDHFDVKISKAGQEIVNVTRGALVNPAILAKFPDEELQKTVAEYKQRLLLAIDRWGRGQKSLGAKEPLVH